MFLNAVFSESTLVKMTEMMNRPGFPLRLNSEPCDRKLSEPEPESEEEEYMLKWGEHSNQVINIFHQLCQVCRGKTEDNDFTVWPFKSEQSYNNFERLAFLAKYLFMH